MNTPPPPKDKMTEKEAIMTLSYFNKWRKGADIPQPHPKEISVAIDTIIKLYKQRNP